MFSPQCGFCGQDGIFGLKYLVRITVKKFLHTLGRYRMMSFVLVMPVVFSRLYFAKFTGRGKGNFEYDIVFPVV